MQKTPVELVERAARVYKTNKDASLALGITTQAFSRICRRHQIETPRGRKQSRRLSAAH